MKEIVAERPSRFTSGHRMCAGCGAPPVARMILRALKPEDHAVRFQALYIHIQHGQIHIFILHLNVLLLPYLEQKQHINQ